jgi:hypothetical protein
MAGLPWIKVWTRVAGHPKVQGLEREMGIKDALGVVIRLWAWTADYAPDGEIPEAEALNAAKYARGESCRKSPAAVLESLRVVGLLDRIPGGYRVHDWHDMQTVHVEAEEKRKAQAAERQRNWRARHGVTTRNGSRNELRNGDSVTETEKEKETERETEVSETASQSEAPPWLAGVRAKLAQEFGRKEPLGIGKDPARVVASFARWVEAVGEDFTVSDCARVARDKNAVPANLAWWPGWLDTVSDAQLHRWRSQGVGT